MKNYVKTELEKNEIFIIAGEKDRNKSIRLRAE